MSFGWPPSVTDEQPAHLVDWMLRLRHEHLAAEQAVANRENS